MAANKVTAVRVGLGQQTLNSPGLSKPPDVTGGFFLALLYGH